MNEYIAFDSHKHYTLVERQDVRTGKTRQHRIEHRHDLRYETLKKTKADLLERV